MINLLAKIFICFYWIVLIGHNIYNYRKTPIEARKRNYWIKALIFINLLVIIFTAIAIFIN